MAYGSHLEGIPLKGLDYYTVHIRPYRSKNRSRNFLSIQISRKDIPYLRKTHVKI